MKLLVIYGIINLFDEEKLIKQERKTKSNKRDSCVENL